MKKYTQKIEELMNPYKDFNPETFDPMETSAGEEWKRERVLPPKELPTFNIKPKEIRQGQMIGMFESKQDLYLIFAHRINELQKEVDELKLKIKKYET